MATNPAPRPALRKAPDASVHPAAPVVGPDSPPGIVQPKPMPGGKAPTHLRPVVGIGGSTSDVLRRVPADPKDAAAKKAKKQSKKAAKAERKRRQQRVELQVKVPKDVRNQLRKNAKARGTSVDDVVTSVLEGWLHA
ncbi:MAG: hypothetical protein RLZ55_523 [Actinomycetota bacterium]|jgi:thiamine pyrophosphate-dependent acetolactate synthase large subunit-like protein